MAGPERRIPVHGHRGHGDWWPHMVEPLRALGARIAEWFSPQAAAAGDEHAYEITLELPGVDADDVDVRIESGVLTVRGEKRAEHAESGRHFHVRERVYGAFERAFRLPDGVDEDKIAADFADGVLTLRLPRSPTAPARARRIPIRPA